MAKKILITGAAGFIGSNIVEYLSKDEYEITATWNCHEPRIRLTGVDYQKVDLADENEVSQLFTSAVFDAVIHLAGPMTGQYIKGYLKDSVNATDNLITLSQEHGVKTFIYASTIAIYGNTEKIVSEVSDQVNLDDYATAKHIGERLLEDSKIKNCIVIRFTRMVGKNMNLSAPWLPKLAANLINNREITYFNPELLYNNVVHTDNLGEFLKNILKKEQRWKGYHVVGLGSSEPIRVIDIIHYLQNALNSKSTLREITENVPRNKCFCIDISRAIEYGYEPWTVQETLKRFVRDLKNEIDI